MNTSNLKDVMSNIAAWLIAFGTFLAGLNLIALHLPVWVTAVGLAMVGLGGVITSVFTAKNPNGTTKTPTQVVEQNTEAAATKEIK